MHNTPFPLRGDETDVPRIREWIAQGRHKNRRAVQVSSSGGRARYVWVEEEEGRILFTLFGSDIGAVYVDGEMHASHADHMTLTTRDALAAIFGSATRNTPGSKGGEPGEWTMTVRGTDVGRYLTRIN
jgi:hypothetical protein